MTGRKIVTESTLDPPLPMATASEIHGEAILVAIVIPTLV